MKSRTKTSHRETHYRSASCTSTSSSAKQTGEKIKRHRGFSISKNQKRGTRFLSSIKYFNQKTKLPPLLLFSPIPLNNISWKGGVREKRVQKRHSIRAEWDSGSLRPGWEGRRRRRRKSLFTTLEKERNSRAMKEKVKNKTTKQKVKIGRDYCSTCEQLIEAAARVRKSNKKLWLLNTGI